MITRFFFRLLGLAHQPPEPFQGEVEGVLYHVDTAPHGNVGIWIDLPRDRMVIEQQLLKRHDHADQPSRTAIDYHMQPLWTLGAQSIDIGFSGDKIEIVVPAFLKKVDKEFAEQVVVSMVQVRHEALGEGVAHEMHRPWAMEAERTLDIDGQALTFAFSSCVVHTEGDLAGNFDLMVRTEPPLSPEQLAENLWLAIPGYDDLVDVSGYGSLDSASEMIFALRNSLIEFDDAVKKVIISLKEVEVCWGNNRDMKLATVQCERPTED